jgi:hypothetical protein
MLRSNIPSKVAFSALVALASCGGQTTGNAGDSGTTTGRDTGTVHPHPDGGHPGSDGSSGLGDSGRDTGTIAPVKFGKVDILFDIDNSASMGDKQQYLAQAIPDMISRLITPRCVDSSGNPVGTNAAIDGTGCPTGSTVEFAPVTDMHIGVVTSALGSRLGVVEPGTPPVMVCDPAATIQGHAGYTVSEYNDDQAHLINRTAPNGSGAALAEASPSNFLEWFPAVAANAGKTPGPGATPITTAGAPGMADTLNGDFTEVVGGAGQSGCGIESQLESWYRFLIQPDPYASLELGTCEGTGCTPDANWVGVDATIIQQRHDFLRPDSIVAVVVLTDENDSEIDVRSYEQTGYQFMSVAWSPPRGTEVCQTNPDDPSCESCAFLSNPMSDPSCAQGNYTSQTDWGDNLNLRHVHMLQKYGLDPQFPLKRYYNGLTSKTVPNRDGEYPTGAGSYVGTNNCDNPLFAGSLPPSSDATLANVGSTLCHLTPGTRTAGDVFFLHIGGVPHELLQGTPGGADGSCPAGTAAADCPQKGTLAFTDWVKILGNGAASYTGSSATLSHDYTGIDPHMIESEWPRNQLGTAAAPGTVAPPSSNPAVSTLSGPALGSGMNAITPDPINGREWITNSGDHSLPVDRQYACIFQLPPASQRDCSTLGSDTMTTIEYNSCDCTGLGDTPEQVPPLCSTTFVNADGTAGAASPSNDYTVQVYAKAYPTIRELTLASMLGSQGIVSSLCPIHTVDNSASGDDPLYGYRPAVSSLLSRMKAALAP